MTVKTSAERLRLMIAEEDEYVRQMNPEQLMGVAPMQLVNGTSAAIRVFLEAAHQHQYPGVKATGKSNPCQCWICMCVQEMIRAFGEATG